MQPAGARSELWSRFSQLHHEKVPQNFIVCQCCRTVLKWSSETDTTVMKHHNFEHKSTSKPGTPSSQRTISSLLPPAPDDYSLIKERIVDPYVSFVH